MRGEATKMMFDGRPIWLVAAAALGVVAGISSAIGSQSLAIAAVLGLVFAALTFWRIEAGLSALLLSMPLDIYGRIISDPIPLTVFQVVLGITLMAWALRLLVDVRRWLRFSVVDLGMVALVLAAFVSVTFSAAPSTSLYAAIRVALLWLFTLLFSSVINDERGLRWIFKVLFATGAFFGLFGFAQQYVPGFNLGNVNDQVATDVGDYSRAAGLFDDPNYFAGFLSAVFVAAFAFAVHARGRRQALIYLAIAACSGVGLLATFSRTGWVGALLGCVIVALTAPPRRRIRIVSAGVTAALLVVLIAPGQIVYRATSIFDTQTDTSNITRWGMYVSTIQMIGDDWVQGTGLGAFDQVYPEYRQPDTLISITRPHELPLAFWAEMGVLGLAAEILLFGGVALLFWPRYGREWSVYESAALAGLGTLLAETLFQYYLYFEYLWLFVALCVIASRLARQQEEGAR